jgi:hypothetical protein
MGKWIDHTVEQCYNLDDFNRDVSINEGELNIFPLATLQMLLVVRDFVPLFLAAFFVEFAWRQVVEGRKSLNVPGWTWHIASGILPPLYLDIWIDEKLGSEKLYILGMSIDLKNERKCFKKD